MGNAPARIAPVVDVTKVDAVGEAGRGRHLQRGEITGAARRSDERRRRRYQDLFPISTANDPTAGSEGDQACYRKRGDVADHRVTAGPATPATWLTGCRPGL